MGRAGEPEYNAWNNMWDRCTNPRSKSYQHYGGRGITVCERWRSYENFFADMGPRPSGPVRLTLERTDNSQGYSPENCRWATFKDQNNNTRKNRVLEHDGLTLSFAAWAERLGMTYNTIRGRINLGWSADDALTRPVKPKPGKRGTSGWTRKDQPAAPSALPAANVRADV